MSRSFRGDFSSTTVWHGTGIGIERVHRVVLRDRDQHVVLGAADRHVSDQRGCAYTAPSTGQRTISKRREVTFEVVSAYSFVFAHPLFVVVIGEDARKIRDANREGAEVAVVSATLRATMLCTPPNLARCKRRPL